MKKALLSIIVILWAVSAIAQETEFEQMKKSLNENSLPLVNLRISPLRVNKKFYIPGEIEIVDYQRRTDPDTISTKYSCQIKYRGGSTLAYKKKSYAVKLISQPNVKLNANLFGIRKEDSWILDAMANDNIRMRNRVCFDIWNEMSHTPYETKHENRNGTEGVFVEVFINGSYHGLYCLTDKINRKLLGLKKLQEDIEGNIELKGLLYKGDAWNDYTDIYLRSYTEVDEESDMWNSWEQQYPNDYISSTIWQPLMNLIDFFSDATSDEDFIQSYQDYIYRDNFADYVLFTLALSVDDNLYKNTFLSTVDITEGHKFMISPWDMDASFGAFYDGSYISEDHRSWLANINRYNERAPFNRLTAKNLDGFNDLLASKWHEFQDTIFSISNITKRLQDYAHLFTISGAWKREVERWQDESAPLKENIEEELEIVKDYYTRNYNQLCEQLGATESVNGITQFGQNREKIIYTLDGRKVNMDATHNLAKGIYIANKKKVFIK